MDDKEIGDEVRSIVRAAAHPSRHWTEEHAEFCRELRKANSLNDEHVQCAMLTERPRERILRSGR